MHKILIVGEHDGKHLNPATAKCVTCAAKVPEAQISIALLGADTTAVAAQAAALAGVKSVVRVDRAERRKWRRSPLITPTCSGPRPVSAKI
jgi:electron transfer flavoprotein alpha subunit